MAAKSHGPEVSFSVGDGGDWGVVQFGRPGTANALDLASVSELERVLAGTPPGIRLLVLRGAGAKSFMSGGDIAAMHGMDVAKGAEFARAGQRLTRALEEHPALIGAVVNGYALGGGTEIALACDAVVATSSAVFGLPEVRLGIVPGWGGTQRLVRAVGLQQGLRYLMTGARFGAEEALRLGLVCDVVPDLEAALLWWSRLAGELRQASPAAAAAAKRAARRGMSLAIEEALSIEFGEWLAQFAGPDRQEGMAAFLGRRSATWTPGPAAGAI
jgi:enoyl-CoA hydratase